jgi:hypothetical protein
LILLLEIDRDLRCLRNTIHTHLLITYIMADLTWIVTAILQVRTPVALDSFSTRFE